MKKIIFTFLIMFLFVVGAKAQLQTEKYGYLMEQWDDAHKGDGSAFSKLYNDTIYFYGETVEGGIAAARKAKVLSNDKTYRQRIDSLRIIKINDHYIQCYFDKWSTVKGVDKKYPSFITWVKKGDEWLIRSENDLYTEMTIAKRKYKLKTPDNYEENVDWGDFIGDKTIQCVWVEGATLVNDESWDDGCVGDCDSYVRFSNGTIPSIRIENCIYGDAINLGDINLNGTTELGIVPHWPTSCWSPFYVFTFIDGKWEKVFEPVISTHCLQFDDGNGFPVKLLELSRGKVRVTYTSTINVGTEDQPDLDFKVKVKEIDTTTEKYDINIYDKEDYWK